LSTDDPGLDSLAAAGITLPRTAQTQYQIVLAVPAGQPLLPGDLVFYGAPGRIHHVGIYLGYGGQMVDAPTSDRPYGSRRTGGPATTTPGRAAQLNPQ
jgi:cell wall-associated NlpC family hydrolase